ncbi:MAG: methionine synthase, partial [Candidatus Cryptobacteroides sp.]
ASIHRMYLEAGADIIETDTFNAQRLSQAEYGTASQVREMNLAAAGIARREADRMTAATPGKPRFVAGSVGPTGKTASISPDVDDPAYRDVDFDLLEEIYTEQMTALVEGGVDLLLMETVFDTLNVKAALSAARNAFRNVGRTVPVMVSASVTDMSGRILSGQTVDAFLASVAPFGVFSIGLNCSFGADRMLPLIEELSAKAPFFVSAHPNAGMPDELGNYDQGPEVMAAKVRPFLERGLVNIIGGCCGTTPEHIAAIAAAVSSAVPRRVPDVRAPWLSGIDAFYDGGGFIKVGERCNVAGSRKFLRLVKEKNYSEALEIAAAQVRAGADVIDVNMDDAMLDPVEEMHHFLNLMASDPEISKVPVMVDSSRFEVIGTALKCLQGKPIVNSLSLKEGEEVFLKRAVRVRELGAALVVMAFDEQGQADTFERRIEICSRAYRILVEKAGFNPCDIIFDPNVLAVATGMREHDAYALDFIRSAEWIHANLPGAKVSGGLSNLSFSFRGNSYIREAMHTVFLHHAVPSGLDMAIVNPSSSLEYGDIPEDLRNIIEDVILCRREDATARLLEAASGFLDRKIPAGKAEVEDRSGLSLEQRLADALRKGDETYLKDDLQEALSAFPSAQAIVEGPLMRGMTAVGDLFAQGRMFLPQVVKTARTMKSAVDFLRPYFGAGASSDAASSNGRYLIATVKGDVHDIGKNIAAVVLSCNNFEVIDLGVMTPAEKIVSTAIEKDVDFIGLSGLITPSLDEMCNVAVKLREAGVSKPLFIGGATTSELHTAVKIAPLYDGPVFYVRDAAQNPVIASSLMTSGRDEVIAALRERQEELRRKYAERNSPAADVPGGRADSGQAVPVEETSRSTASQEIAEPDRRNVVKAPPYLGIRTLDDIPVETLVPYVNWASFCHLWGVKAGSPEADGVIADARAMLESFRGKYTMRSQVAFYEAWGKDDSIVVLHPEGCPCCGLSLPENVSGRLRALRSTVIPTKRQDKPGSDGRRLSLADFVAPQGCGDHIGVFAVTVCKDFVRELERLKAGNDDFRSILMQSLGDRLAEAASEYLHEQVRKHIWGYSPDENLTIRQMYSAKYQGIRPAVGYPSLPDVRLMSTVSTLLDLDTLGITLTENGAMYPQSSVCGLYISNPESRYFVA